MFNYHFDNQKYFIIVFKNIFSGFIATIIHANNAFILAAWLYSKHIVVMRETVPHKPLLALPYL